MKKSSTRGYSLVEVMIVVAIVGIVAGSGGLLFTQLENFYMTVNARNIVQRDDRVSLDLMDKFIRQADHTTICIDSPGAGSPCACMGGLSTAGGYWSRICFTTIDGRNVRFYENGSSLNLGLEASGASVYDVSTLSKNLAYLSFSFPNSNDPTIINVSLATSQAVQLSRKDVLAMSIQKVRVMN